MVAVFGKNAYVVKKSEEEEMDDPVILDEESFFGVSTIVFVGDTKHIRVSYYPYGFQGSPDLTIILYPTHPLYTPLLESYPHPVHTISEAAAKGREGL